MDASLSLQQRVAAYYRLTKPGIIYGNAISLLAGFMLAAQRHVDWPLLLAALSGTALVIASGCVLNNHMDRGIDARMERTRGRALVTGDIAARGAIIYAGLLSLAGFSILTLCTNTLTVYVGLVGLYFYVVAYGIWKRRSPLGTIVGSVSGSAPIVAGYTAASGRLDLGALLLFVSMALWQLPHFYAIAIFRLRDYRAAEIPVLPAVSGVGHTKRQIIIYAAAYMAAAGSLSLTGYTGIVYGIGILVLGGWWIWKGLRTYRTTDDIRWARGMFGASLLVMVGMSLLLAISPFLP